MENERKSPEERQKMTDLERLRHSCAHVLATAMAKLWPDAQFAAGPPVENGFYYDVELSHRVSPEDFPRIEEEMKRVVKENQPFEKVVVSRDQALASCVSLNAPMLPVRMTCGPAQRSMKSPFLK